MSFVLSKLLWVFSAPANLLVFVLGGALLLLRGRGKSRAAGWWLLALSISILVILGAIPVGQWMAAPLENRFQVLELPEKVDGIIVLGGSVIPWKAEGRSQPALDKNSERLIEFAGLVRRYPDAKAVFTGGSGAVQKQHLKEAPLARAALGLMGVDTDRVIFEAESRNTFENAVFSKELVNPKPDEAWLLVTSAMHMPRSIGIFRKVGWNVIPYPCDFETPAEIVPGLGFDVLEGLSLVQSSLREYIGLVAYYYMGHTSELFPSPTP